MPEVFLKSDPSVRKPVSQEDAAELLATGEWELSQGQKVFLADSRGETFAVDATQAEYFLGGERLEPQDVGFESSANVVRRAQHQDDIEEYAEGFGNKLLMGVEAVGSGLTLGATDALFGGRGTSLRREEAGGFGTALELGGALLPALITGGAAGAAAGARIGARGLAGRILARTPAGLAMRAGEAARVATGARVASLARTGALGRGMAAIAPAVSQGITEGAIYGAGEGLSDIALSGDPMTSEAVFSAMGGSALHGAAFGGAIMGGLSASGVLLRGVQKRVQGRLEGALDSQGRREMERRLADVADEEVSALRRRIEAERDTEMLDLLEQQGAAKQGLRVQEEVGALRRIGERGRTGAERAAEGRTLKQTFATERRKVATREAGELEALDAIERTMRGRVDETFGIKDLSKNPQVRELGTQFAGELSDMAGTMDEAWKIMKLNADYLGMPMVPVRQYKTVYDRFKQTFAPKGRVIKDPIKLARMLSGPNGPANRKILAEVEDAAGKAFTAQTGSPVAFDDLLANYKVTDEFIKATEIGVGSEASRKIRSDMFAQHMGVLERDTKIALDEIMQRGRDGVEEIAQREGASLKRIAQKVDDRIAAKDAEISSAIDRSELDRIASDIDALGKRDISKRVEADLRRRADRVGEIAASEGLRLNTLDKIAIANEIGLDFDVIPEGSLMDKVLSLYGVMRLASGQGPAKLVNAVAAKSGLGKIAGGVMARVGKTAMRNKMTGRKLSLGATLKGAVADLGTGGIAKRFKDAEVKLLQSIDRNIDRFVRTGVKLRPYTVPTAIKVLNSASFLADEPKADVRVEKDLTKVFNERSEELSMAASNPEGAAEIIGDRLGLLAYREPLLSGQLVALALKRIQFLHDKMPKNPGIGAFGTEDRWRPSDAEISKWARYIEASDNPENSIEAMGFGRMSLEQSETMAALYPEIYDRVRMEIYEKVTESPKDMSYPQRIQLSILYRTPVDSTMRTDFMSAMQANFLPKIPPPPASQVNLGRLTPTSIEAATPAQRTLTR